MGNKKKAKYVIPEAKLLEFLLESNKIERKHGYTPGELIAYKKFLKLELPTITDIERVMDHIQPDAILRDTPSAPNVSVGRHIAPNSGPGIRRELEALMNTLDIHSPWQFHRLYEFLHPFTDGNGRTGRLIWLWQMVNMYDWRFERPFLHQFYYQTLAETAK